MSYCYIKMKYFIVQEEPNTFRAEMLDMKSLGYGEQHLRQIHF